MRRSTAPPAAPVAPVSTSPSTSTSTTTTSQSRRPKQTTFGKYCCCCCCCYFHRPSSFIGGGFLVLAYLLLVLSLLVLGGFFSRQQQAGAGAGAALVPLPPTSILRHSRTAANNVDVDVNKVDVDVDDDHDDDDPDKACPFRNSTIYRSVYVYPSPGEKEWQGSILSPEGRRLRNHSSSWPWITIDRDTKQAGRNHYHVSSQHAQFATELLVRQILTHPQSCLRTSDPDRATLFLVPYLPSVEFHAGVRGPPPTHRTSVYAQAISDAIDGDYTGWRQRFGLTEQYWQRRSGSDHVLVFSEPLQGLKHPKNKRGSYHFVHTQRQLDPPIVISVELSTTFVHTHRQCAEKNILMPYPITDGRYFNGAWSRQAAALLVTNSTDSSDRSDLAPAAAAAAVANEIPDEQQQDEHEHEQQHERRPLSVFYRAGLHGSCTALRLSMKKDYKCSDTPWRHQQQLTEDYRLGMRLATFCPCPGGDTASAKRMFDAVLAGCIPVILSHDFVWPLSDEIEAAGPGIHGSIGNTQMQMQMQMQMQTHTTLRPSDFSIRWPAQEFWERKYTEKCQLSNASDISLFERLEQVPMDEIQRLRKGLQRAAAQYSYYPLSSSSSLTRTPTTPPLVENPLRDDILPTGGAAQALVVALEERAGGVKWPACQQELERAKASAFIPEPDQFQC